jgi:drug/metabolite transporter (DMT)-like permease
MVNLKSITSNKKVFVWVSFLFLMLVWGSSFKLMKESLKVFSPMEAASLRLVFAMITVIGFAIPHFIKIEKSKMKHLVLSAVIAMGAPAFMFATAQGAGIVGSIAGILNALTPMMTFLIGILFFKQEMTSRKVIGLLIGFCGSATLILVNQKGSIEINFFAFLIILATVSYGLNVNYIKRYLSDVPSLQLSLITVSLVGVMGLCVLPTTDFMSKIMTHPNGRLALLQIATLGVLGTAVAQIVFNKMLSYTSALFASSITYFIPIVALLWGIFDQETLSLWHYIGMVMIIGGVLIMNKKQNPAPNETLPIDSHLTQK